MSEHVALPGRFARVSVAAERGPVGKTKLYQLAEENAGLFRKFAGVTLVDLDLLDHIIEQSPPAELGLKKGIPRAVGSAKSGENESGCDSKEAPENPK